MRPSPITGYSGTQLRIDIERIREAERLGLGSVWTAEAHGCDAVTPLAWIAAQTRRMCPMAGLTWSSPRCVCRPWTGSMDRRRAAS